MKTEVHVLGCVAVSLVVTPSGGLGVGDVWVALDRAQDLRDFVLFTGRFWCHFESDSVGVGGHTWSSIAHSIHSISRVPTMIGISVSTTIMVSVTASIA